MRTKQAPGGAVYYCIEKGSCISILAPTDVNSEDIFFKCKHA